MKRKKGELSSYSKFSFFEQLCLFLRKKRTICGGTTSWRSYGELRSVDKSECCCYAQVTSDLGVLSPGCGCNEAKVDDIVHELKTRMAKRGNSARIQQAEKQLEKITELERKIDLLMEHLQIPQPNVIKER